MLAIIGGSGLTALSNLDISHREIVRTPYGEPSGPLAFGKLSGRPAVFLPRHGHGHTIPPHLVNYRANIWALKQVGAEGVIGVASVGGVSCDYEPGDIVLPEQIIDYTWGRETTFFDGKDGVVKQVDFTHPFDYTLRKQLVLAAEAIGETVKVGGVYAAIQGPRLETAAEVNRYEQDGAHLVGTTGMPEAVLARELEMPYVSLHLVTNYAAGRCGSFGGIQMSDIEDVVRRRMGAVRAIIEHMVGFRSPLTVLNP